MLILENDLHAHIIIVIDNTLDFPFYLLYTIQRVYNSKLIRYSSIELQGFQRRISFSI
jgi:hypothetical protein